MDEGDGCLEAGHAGGACEASGLGFGGVGGGRRLIMHLVNALVRLLEVEPRRVVHSYPAQTKAPVAISLSKRVSADLITALSNHTTTYSPNLLH